MATDKSPQRVLDQHQSPLFRLPRELRDEIYDYYTHEDGYIFEPSTQKLRLPTGNPIELALSYTCKRVTKEMNGMALRKNSVEFRTLLSLPKITGQPSNASWYEQLILSHQVRLRHMLKWAHTIVSVEVMLTVKSLYPNSFAAQRILEKTQEGNDSQLRGGYLFNVWSLDNYNSDNCILKEYDLELRKATRSEDDYDSENDSDSDEDSDDDSDDDSDEDSDEDSDDDSDSDDFLLGAFRIKRPPSYSRETQTDILQWRPQLWSIPNRAELEAISEFLPPWPTAIDDPVPDHEYVPDMYFSAAAVGVRFLEGLAPKAREQLRRIVIQEDHPSVASSITHAQGLISFCQANPKVRIERRVDIWPTEFVYRSNYFEHHTHEIVIMIGTWINEVKILYQMGMPADCFTLVLHGPSEAASQQLSDAITRAAIWLEGTVELARREQRRFYPFQGITEDFADVIKEMLRGEIPARFDAEMDEVWDIEKILSEHVGEWPSKVSDVFRLRDFEEPEGGWHAAREAYKEREV